MHFTLLKFVLCSIYVVLGILVHAVRVRAEDRVVPREVFSVFTNYVKEFCAFHFIFVHLSIERLQKSKTITNPRSTF